MPLKELLVSEQKLTEDVLERILTGLVVLSQETRRAILTPEGAKQTARVKILLVLTAQHAWRFIEPGREAPVSLPIKALSMQTGLPGNTLRPKLKELTDEHIVEIVSRGNYQLPPHSLTLIEREMAEARQKSRPRQET